MAAILGYAHGIGVRSGCLCSHPHLLRLTGLTHARVEAARARIHAGDPNQMAGMTRVSFGLHNTVDQVDRFLEALAVVASRNQHARYTQNRSPGEFRPDG